MGKYTENNIYIPDEGEIGWGKEVNSNLYELSNILTKLTEINSSLQHLGNSITDVDSKSESEDTKLQNNLTATAQQLQSKISDTNDKIDVVNTRIDNLNLDKTKYADRSGISAVASKVEHSITINGTVYDGSESINIITYTDSDINDLIKSVNNNLNEVKKKVEDLESGDFKMEVVNELPNVGRMHTMYFVPKTIGETESNAYDEYIWTGEKYELLGDTEAKLQNVYLKNDADERFVNTLNAQTINGTKTFTQSINGNISTANKLANSVLINNTAFDGSQSIITNLWGQTVNANLTDGVHYSSTPINGASDFTLQIPNELDITVNGDLHGNADTSTLATNSINNQNGYELADTLVKDISFDNGKIIISSINNKEKNINLFNVESALKSNNSDHALLADNAINDSEGNKIDETYLKLSGGTLSDSISFANGGILFGNNSFKNIVTETESNFVFDLSDLDDKQKNILFKYGSNNIVTISSDGTVTANKFVGAVASASETANKLTNVRTIILNGDVTGSFEFDGSKDVECDITCTNSKLSETAIKLQTPRTITLNGDVTGSFEFDGSTNTSITTTLNVDTIENSNHANQANELAKSVNIGLSGAVQGSASFNGANDITIKTTSDLESTIMNNMVGNAKEGQVLSTIFDTTKNQNVVASYPLIEFCKIANTADILNQLKLVPVGMSTIFSDWYRFSHWRSEQNLSGNTGHVMPNNTYSGVEHAAARNGWTYDKSTNMIKSNRNSPVYAGFINPLKLKQWYLKVQIYGGGDGDNDGILINVAFMKDSNGIEHTVDLVRARSGAGNGVYLDDKKGMEFYWSLVYDYRQDTQKELANNPNVYCAPTNIPEYGWGTNYACMSCQRNVTNIKCYTSDVVSTPITTVNENSLINYTLPSSKPSDWSDAMWNNMQTMLLNASQMGVGAHSQNGLFTILKQRYIFNDEKIYDMVNDIIWEYSEKTNNWNNVGKCSTSLREGQIYYNESTKQTFYYTNGNAYCIGNGN